MAAFSGVSSEMDHSIHATFHKMKEAAQRRVAPAFVRQYADDFDYVVFLAQSVCGYTPPQIQAAIRNGRRR